METSKLRNDISSLIIKIYQTVKELSKIIELNDKDQIFSALNVGKNFGNQLQLISNLLMDLKSANNEKNF